MIALAVLLFFVVVGTGPEFVDRRRLRAERKAWPKAKVIYLPSASCREPFICPSPDTCALCKSHAKMC